MGKSRNKDFTQVEIEILSKNINVKSVTPKQIIYTDEFKDLFLMEYAAGKMPLQIFVENGFDSIMLGQNRIDKCCMRWRKKACRPEGVHDLKKGHSGKKNHGKFTHEDELAHLKQQNEYLKQENTFLRELRRLERQVMSKGKSNQKTNIK